MRKQYFQHKKLIRYIMPSFTDNSTNVKKFDCIRKSAAAENTVHI